MCAPGFTATERGLTPRASPSTRTSAPAGLVLMLSVPVATCAAGAANIRRAPYTPAATSTRPSIAATATRPGPREASAVAAPNANVSGCASASSSSSPADGDVGSSSSSSVLRTCRQPLGSGFASAFSGAVCDGTVAGGGAASMLVSAGRGLGATVASLSELTIRSAGIRVALVDSACGSAATIFSSSAFASTADANDCRGSSCSARLNQPRRADGSGSSPPFGEIAHADASTSGKFAMYSSSRSMRPSTSDSATTPICVTSAR